MCKSCRDTTLSHGSVTKTCLGCGERFSYSFTKKNRAKSISFCHVCETRLKSNICLQCHEYVVGAVDNYGRCESCSN